MPAEFSKSDMNESRFSMIMERSQFLARQVSRAVEKVRASHLDDAFLATNKGMCYRCDYEPIKRD